MIRHFSIAVIVTSCIFAAISAHAQSTGAPCSAFQKQVDGRWKAVRPINIVTDKGSAVISPGTVIGPGVHVADADVYAALQKNCH